eukprot:1161671-Pelagomonas_calceolata.AAC.12
MEFEMQATPKCCCSHVPPTGVQCSMVSDHLRPISACRYGPPGGAGVRLACSALQAPESPRSSQARIQARSCRQPRRSASGALEPQGLL